MNFLLKFLRSKIGVSIFALNGERLETSFLQRAPSTPLVKRNRMSFYTSVQWQPFRNETEATKNRSQKYFFSEILTLKNRRQYFRDQRRTIEYFFAVESSIHAPRKKESNGLLYEGLVSTVQKLDQKYKKSWNAKIICCSEFLFGGKIIDVSIFAPILVLGSSINAPYWKKLNEPLYEVQCE